jgi:hypothetical protein
MKSNDANSSAAAAGSGANDRDRLTDMIRRLLCEIEEHNAEYKHRTPQELIDEAKALIDPGRRRGS